MTSTCHSCSRPTTRPQRGLAVARLDNHAHTAAKNRLPLTKDDWYRRQGDPYPRGGWPSNVTGLIAPSRDWAQHAGPSMLPCADASDCCLPVLIYGSLFARMNTRSSKRRVATVWFGWTELWLTSPTGRLSSMRGCDVVEASWCSHPYQPFFGIAAATSG